jgi:hypothetical protein
MAVSPTVLKQGDIIEYKNKHVGIVYIALVTHISPDDSIELFRRALNSKSWGFEYWDKEDFQEEQEDMQLIRILPPDKARALKHTIANAWEAFKESRNATVSMIGQPKLSVV